MKRSDFLIDMATAAAVPLSATKSWHGPSDLFNVKAFGARGDGATNDTAAIQAAIDAADAAGGGFVYLPAAAYIASPLSLKSNVTLLGDGIGCTVIRNRSGETAAIIDGAGVTRAGVWDLTIDGTGGSGAANFGIRIHTLSLHCEVRRVQVRDIAAAEGLWIVDSEGCVLDHVEIVNVFSWGVVLQNKGRHELSNIRGWDSASRLLVLRATEHCNVRGVSYYDSAGEVLMIMGASQHNTVVGVVGDNLSAGDAIVIEGPAKYNTVTGFALKNTSGHGVGFNGNSGDDGPQYNVVSDGVIDGPGEAGVTMTNQGIAASVPTGNQAINIVVSNAGRVTTDQAFSVVGGTDNVFRDCTAIAGAQTDYGFRSLDGAGTEARNSLHGRLSGSFTVAEVATEAEDTVVDVWQGTNTPAVLRAGDNSNYSPGRFTALRFSAPVSGSNLTGLADGVHSRKLRLINVGANSLSVEHEGTASLAANRVTFAGGVSATLEQDDALSLEYDGVSSRWRVV
jgi:hypothetical protein